MGDGINISLPPSDDSKHKKTRRKKTLDTLPETNSEFTPENGWLEDYFPFGIRSIFRGVWLVSGRVSLSM